MKYFLGIDLGTSAVKAVVFDESFAFVAKGSAGYELSAAKDGWAEQDPADWREATRTALHQAIGRAGIDAASIAGIGISGQMHGLVMLDGEGHVLRPAILWCDQRSTAECEEITSLVGRQRLVEITANPALPGFTASKILWVRKREPELYARCRHLLLPKDYLRFLLTGRYETEVSDASGMQLLDVPRRTWSDALLRDLDIERAWLPEVHESPDITGYVTRRAAAYFGLAYGTPVAGGAGDNAAAAIGTSTVQEGRSFTTIGTSGVLLTHTDRPCIDKQGRVHTFCHAMPEAWITMGCTLAAGESLRWFLKKILGDTLSFEEALALAADAPCGAHRLLYLPYLMGERSPILDSYARGTFVGLSAMHGQGDLVRAILEGVSYSLKDCYEVFGEMGITFSLMRLCGGGAKSPLWRQILADMYDCQVAMDDSAESGALGVAALAAVGTGCYSSVPAACAHLPPAAAKETPRAEAAAYYQRGYQLYRKVYEDLKQDYRSLSTL